MFNKVCDKWRLFDAATQCGVPVPKTFLVTGSQDIEVSASLLKFPLIIKPVMSGDWGDELAQATGIRKVVVVATPTELRNVYTRISPFEPRVLLQEYIPGGDECIRVFASVFDGTQDIASFVGHKLLQHPEGISAVVEIEANEALRETSLRLLKSLGFRGMSEVEFKQDAKTGVFKLIEVNVRHWVWHQLGTINGINISLCYYNYLMNLSQPHTEKSLQTKWVDDTKLLAIRVETLAGRSKISATKLRAALAGRVVGAVFRWNDPLPYIVFAASYFWDIFSRSSQRALSKIGLR
jgi:predicted ATP-grasp superfamily ATP-dependent carboligase